MSKSRNAAPVAERNDIGTFEVSELPIYSEKDVEKEGKVLKIEVEGDETAKLDSETLIRSNTPTFDLHGIDDLESGKAEKPQAGFHVNGKRHGGITEDTEETEEEQTEEMDRETRIRLMTPTFGMHGVDDVETETAIKPQSDFHVNGIRTSVVPEAVETAVEFELTGLCVTCEARNECLQARSEHVVWHCEEYL